MRMTLRRIRDVKHWKRKYAAKLFHIDVERLRAIEEYREVPTFNELIIMLKVMGYYFDEVLSILQRDIEDHYILNERNNNNE